MIGLLRSVPLRLTAAYLRSSKSDFARWRLVRYAIGQTRDLGRAMGRATVTTHFGYRMELDLSDWVDQHIYATGDYEGSTARTIAALLSPGDCCIDVGANIGFFTLLMAKCVTAAGAVLAFEPLPPTRARLLRNLALNGVSHVTVREEALSDADGTARFFGGGGDHSGLSSLRPLDTGGGVIEVPTRKLTACLPPGFRPRLIKMDIEGAEHLALRGMEQVLREERPDIVIEVSDHFLKEMGSSAPALCQYLLSFGYSMYRIDWNNVVKCENFDSSLPTQFNALFTVRTELPPGVPRKMTAAR